MQGNDFGKTQFIADIELDVSIGRHPNADIEHERKVAIYDLKDSNTFSPIGAPLGPYSAILNTVDNRLTINLKCPSGEAIEPIIIAMSPFRSIMKDYAQICNAYMNAIRASTPSRIEAIDMGRRGLHNEGSEKLREILIHKVEIDDDTARRLFTLLYVLQMRG